MWGLRAHHGARRQRDVWRECNPVRIILGATVSERDIPLPKEVRSHPVPVPYERSSFRSFSNGVAGRCSLCLRDAHTMVRGVGRRSLALCDLHDRRHRWVRDPNRKSWWYLAPPNRVGPDAWWHIYRSDVGVAGGRPGWYAGEFDGECLIDLRAQTVHRAIVNAERVLSLPAVVAYRHWTAEYA
jgi:hypothetical protein